MKFHIFSSIDNMMANIVAESAKGVWQSIEEERNPFKRCEQRKMYMLALHKLNRSKNHE